MARSGESYIIQGPPGTGKSQTITNLIADYIARDKKILFVCEKRAALDVVYHRLKNKSLDELCCLVHDSQSDKKSFILDLKKTYEHFLINDFDADKITSTRAGLIDAINKELDKLKYFHEVMDQGEVAPLQLFEVLHATKGNKELPKLNEILNYPSYMEWQQNLVWINEWFEALKVNGLGEVIANYPFVNLSGEILNASNPKIKIQEIVTNATNLLDEFSEVLDDLDEDDTGLTLLDWSLRCEIAKKVSGILSKGKLDVLDAKSESALALANAHQVIVDLTEDLHEVTAKNENWKTKFSFQDNKAAIAQWSKFKNSVFRFVNPTYYKLKKVIQENYDFTAHVVAPEIEHVLDDLDKEYELQETLKKRKAKLSNEYGLDHYDQDIQWIKSAQLEQGIILSEWLKNDHQELILTLNKFSNKFLPMIEDLQKIFGEQLDIDFNQFEIVLSNAEKALSSFSAFIPFIKQLSSVSTELKNCLTSKKWKRTDFEFYLAYKSLTDIYEVERSFAEMDEDGIRLSINRINALFDKYYTSNVDLIRARVRQKFLQMIKVTESTAAQLTEGGKKLKKQYLNSRRILENEFGKSMRYKSIRELATSDANEFMSALKPVWLMSPLSVSDTMPIDPLLFDVVIFDEASQITVEEGVPALFRTKQTIIVGDEMQMPPTNFFNSINLQDDEDEELEDKIGITLDADSLLNQGTRKLSSVMLGWHYRSRHESLISFSNAAFYQRGLLTIPDNTIQAATLSPIPPIVDVEGKVNVDDILSRSISYHLLENGVYENRRNKDESAYIANMVCELLKSKCRKSIGIVAFSKEQQSEIEETLDRLASYDPEFESLLEEEYLRMDEDQYNGLFVKNLENVQGDERDIIIMSVCYGYNPNGRMLMNFGPINRRGGEKRLNVIFSRAKEHMVVVTSIGPHEIKNEYNEGANYFKKFLTYAQHISDNRLKEANTILDGLNLTPNNSAIKSEKLMSLQLKSALEDRGYQVDLSIGQSHFKCDLGIRSQIKDHYDLGILIDHEAHYANKNVLEQYCQRPQVLESFGWKTITVFSKDWLEKPLRVIERIEQVLNGSLDEKEDVESLIQEVVTENEAVDYYIPDEEKNAPQTEEPTEPVEDNAPLLKADLDFHRLEFSAGSSNKYWQIAQEGCQVIIQYGRIGNNPQENVKNFASPEKASEEKEKMINKKKAKGYSSPS